MSELDKLYEMIDDMEVAMMTTRRSDGHLVSRAMANQDRAPGADLWFVSSTDTDKIEEIETDPHVNLAYYKNRTREWISISGMARTSHDQDLIRKLWKPDWKAWFSEDDGDPRRGTPEDPRIVLIGVEVHSAIFLEQNKPQPVVLYELVKGLLTGKQPDVGKMHHIGS